MTPNMKPSNKSTEKSSHEHAGQGVPSKHSVSSGSVRPPSLPGTITLPKSHTSPPNDADKYTIGNSSSYDLKNGYINTSESGYEFIPFPRSWADPFCVPYFPACERDDELVLQSFTPIASFKSPKRKSKAQEHDTSHHGHLVPAFVSKATASKHEDTDALITDWSACNMFSPEDTNSDSYFSHQNWLPNPQFNGPRRNWLLMYPLHSCYYPTCHTMVDITSLKPAIDDLVHQIDNFGSGMSIDLFNGCSILEADKFVNNFDDIELKHFVYHQDVKNHIGTPIGHKSNAYIMHNKNISESGHLCTNIMTATRIASRERKDDEPLTVMEFFKTIMSKIENSDEAQYQFLGFVRIHLSSPRKEGAVMKSFALASFIIYSQVKDTNIVHLCMEGGNFLGSTMAQRLCQILQVTSWIKNGHYSLSLYFPSVFLPEHVKHSYMNMGFIIKSNENGMVTLTTNTLVKIPVSTNQRYITKYRALHVPTQDKTHMPPIKPSLLLENHFHDYINELSNIMCLHLSITQGYLIVDIDNGLSDFINLDCSLKTIMLGFKSKSRSKDNIQWLNHIFKFIVEGHGAPQFSFNLLLHHLCRGVRTSKNKSIANSEVSETVLEILS